MHRRVPRCERDDEPDGHQSRRASSSSRRRSVSGSISVGGSGGSDSCVRLQRQTPTASSRAPARTPPSGSHHASRSKPLCGGAARIPCPKLPTSSVSICFADQHCRDAPRDLRLDLLRGRRLRHVERRVAGRAHDLALEIRERRLRMRARRGRAGERERGRRHSDDAKHHWSSAAWMPRSNAATWFVIVPMMCVPDEAAPAVDEVGLGHAGQPVLVADHAGAVLHRLIRDAVMRQERARVARHVVVVDTDEDDALRAVLPRRLLEHLRFALARHAPRRPEVDDDRLAAQRRQIELARSLDASQREVRRRPADLRRVRLMREPPHEQTEQPGDGDERQRLAGELQRPRHDATMKTGVPTATWSNSHSASGTSMRTQPCDSE